MIVVTGTNGIVGRAVVQALAKSNFPFIALTRQSFDLASGRALRDFVSQRPEGIIHLASAVPHSTNYPDNEESANMTRRIDGCVFDAAKEWDCRLIYASSCYLYERLSTKPCIETDPIPQHPESHYLESKRLGEALFSQLNSFVICRLPAPIGPGVPTTVVAGRFLELAVQDREIRLWGTGKREQNFVDVDDLSDGLVKGLSSSECGVFNLSADEPTTMLELANTVVTVVGKGRIKFSGQTDPMEHTFTRYSNRKSQLKLGWSPKTPIAESIRKMLAK